MCRASEVVTSIDGAALDSPLLVLPVGDALQEPFWPEGLGVNRGYHNMYDGVWAAHQWSVKGAADDPVKQAAIVRERQFLYESKTRVMSAKNRSMLKGFNADGTKNTAPKPAKTYSPDPATRYNPPLLPGGKKCG